MIPHISYSQYSTYKKCPRSWYLGKIQRAPERPAWYTLIGSATHQMIEEHLRGVPYYDGRSLDVQEFLYPLIASARERDPDTTQWMHSLDGDGNPIIERRAVEFVQLAFERALDFLEDIDVWEVEYDASGFLPGCPVEIKAFVDIIGEHKKRKRPIILDWKTGKHKDPFQLETYAALMKSKFDPKFEGYDWEGYFAMLAPWAPQSRYKDLSDVDSSEVGAKYGDTYKAMAAKFYKTTHAEAICGFCFQRDNCLLRSEDRERAEYYDRSAEDGFPF